MQKKEKKFQNKKKISKIKIIYIKKLFKELINFILHKILYCKSTNYINKIFYI